MEGLGRKKRKEKAKMVAGEEKKKKSGDEVGRWRFNQSHGLLKGTAEVRGASAAPDLGFGPCTRTWRTMAWRYL